MTIQLLQPYNGLRPGIYSNLGATEEARLVALPGNMARYYTAGMDGYDPRLSDSQESAVQALVSADGNLAEAAVASTTGTPGEVRKLSDGPNKGAALTWAIPDGRSTYAWCWQIYPLAAYL